MLRDLDASSERLLGLARDEAEPLGSVAVEPVHLLLAVLHEVQRAGADALPALPDPYAGLTYAEARGHVAHRSPAPRSAQGGYLPASRALMALLYAAADLAVSEAGGTSHPPVQGRHLLSVLRGAPDVGAVIDELPRVQDRPPRQRTVTDDVEGPEVVLPAEYEFGSELGPDWDQRDE
jgi:hypothetical protein